MGVQALQDGGEEGVELLWGVGTVDVGWLMDIKRGYTQQHLNVTTSILMLMGGWERRETMYCTSADIVCDQIVMKYVRDTAGGV